MIADCCGKQVHALYFNRVTKQWDCERHCPYLNDRKEKKERPHASESKASKKRVRNNLSYSR